jgi:hypothetical protein
VVFAEWAVGELKIPPEGHDALEVLDLKAQLQRLVEFVRRANGLDDRVKAVENT